MTEFIDRMLITSAFRIILSIAIGSITGCIDAGSPQVTLPTSGEWQNRIAIVAAATQYFQPPLMDCLKKPDGDSGATPTQTNLRPVVVVYGDSWSPIYKRMKTDTQADTSIHWVFDDSSPNWMEGPVGLRWKGQNGWLILKRWPGLNAFLKMWEQSQKSTAIRSAAPMIRRSVIYGRGTNSGWSWPGDLRQHLTGTHGVNPTIVNGWTDRQCMSYHDAMHDGRYASISRHRAISSCNLYRRRVRSGNCPNGNCPL